MSKLVTPCRYDFVGSFLRPNTLKKARRQFDEGEISYDELKKVEDQADHRHKEDGNDPRHTVGKVAWLIVDIQSRDQGDALQRAVDERKVIL